MDEKLWLKKAYEFAEKNSPDPSTQVGAVILDSNYNFLTYGFNGFPLGVNGLVAIRHDRLERPKKYQYIEHAERSAIFRAAKEGKSVKEGIMVCPWFACTECARAIILSGIRLVLGHKLCVDNTPEHWKESLTLAWDMLKEAKIELRWYEGKIFDNDSFKVKFNGQFVNP